MTHMGITVLTNKIKERHMEALFSQTQISQIFKISTTCFTGHVQEKMSRSPMVPPLRYINNDVSKPIELIVHKLIM